MNFHTRASAFPEREIVFLSEDGSVEENFSDAVGEKNEKFARFSGIFLFFW